MYYSFVDKPELKIKADIDINSLSVQLPLKNFHTKEELKEIKKRPYILKRRALFSVMYKNEQYCFLFERGYTWDGATIPKGTQWIIGPKGCPAFLLSSMVHDKLCENHNFIKNDRHLSSLIFKELLLASDVGEVKANIMFNAVDNFQKICGGWDESNSNKDGSVATV